MFIDVHSLRVSCKFHLFLINYTSINSHYQCEHNDSIFTRNGRKLTKISHNYPKWLKKNRVYSRFFLLYPKMVLWYWFTRTMRLTTGKISRSQNWFTTVFSLVLLGKKNRPPGFFGSNWEFYNRERTRKKPGKNDLLFVHHSQSRNSPFSRFFFMVGPEPLFSKLFPVLLVFFFRHRYLFFFKKRVQIIGNNTDKTM